EEAGYLVRQDESGTRGALRRLDVSRADVTWLLNRVGISDRALLRYLPQWLVDAAAEQVPGNHALFDVDHARTRAFMFGSGSVFINDTRRFAEGVVPPAAVPALKAELKAVLAGLTDPQTGEPVLEVVDGEALYRDGELTPDLVVSGRDGYERMTTLTDRALVPSAERGTAASHRREGMVLAWGPTVRPGGTLAGATVV
ncbi:MAG: phosphodiesterase, partial [Actinobacteria bacterium]|nr:phosphodiesterase [Actinomycetota bacterium]NIS31606.1 phosphodiesterase [Actinomycetota bacterium]NIU66721.1 phosphodiesterase [Actinomycetota bacterium]NIW28522.1 phosphodiesterase [Actinomycetota bacterium]NIX21003.1 phosphodiesterase [Actinomycetota bacterium]